MSSDTTISKTKEIVEASLTLEFFFRMYSPESEPKSVGNENYICRCPFHDDKKPSFCFTTAPGTLGIYNCYGCGAKGNIYTFLQKKLGVTDKLNYLKEQLNISDPDTFKSAPRPKPVKPEPKKILPPIDPEMILEAKKQLFESTTLLKKLESFSINTEIAKKLNVGYKNGRFWIPIKDDSGEFRNVRLWGPDMPLRVISYKAGYGENRLWPLDNINSDTIYLVEGEKDALVLMSVEHNGHYPFRSKVITNTTGANSWNDNWGKLFRNKNVIIVMDIDDAGKKGADIRAENIKPFARQVKIITLDLDETKWKNGDIANYFNEEGRSYNEFMDLVAATSALKTVSDNSDGTENDTVENTVILSEASKASFIEQKCLIKNVIACGKDTSPFAAPKTISATCEGSRQYKKCGQCALQEKDFSKQYDKMDTNLLDFIRTPSNTLEKKIKLSLGINSECSFGKIKESEFYTIENIRLIPEISHNVEDDYEHVYRAAYHVSDGGNFVKTNQSYNLKCVTTRDRKTQHVVHQIYDMESSQNDLDNWKLTPEMKKKLSIFQVDYENGETVESKLDDIYEEFSKSARIYGRKDIFRLMDMSFHSVLSFNFQGKPVEKGWVEVCVLGDTRLGKTEQARFLSRHYRVGEFVSGESSTYTGLVAGISQQGGTWSLQWGSIPLNDKKIVIIDETSGIPVDDIAKFSEIRSSGQASIKKVIQESTRARTRIIWLSNPRKSQGSKYALKIRQYSFGIKAINEVFGTPEDVGRLDAVGVVASGEVSPEMMNQKPDPYIEKYDSDACFNLVMFAFSLVRNKIHISPEVEAYILKKSVEISAKYSSVVPIIDSSDSRFRVAKFAIAHAVRVFSINDKDQLLVTKEHVDAAITMLTRLYESDASGFRRLSIQEKSRETLNDPEEVARILGLKEEFKIDEILNSPTMPRQALNHMLEDDLSSPYDPMSRQAKLRELKRNYAVKEMSNYFIIEKGLHDLCMDLKSWYVNGGQYSGYWVDKKMKLNDKEELD